jgi:hypothetical protein
VKLVLELGRFCLERLSRIPRVGLIVLRIWRRGQSFLPPCPRFDGAESCGRMLILDYRVLDMKQDQEYFHYYSYAILKHPAQRYIPSLSFSLSTPPAPYHFPLSYLDGTRSIALIYRNQRENTA